MEKTLTQGIKELEELLDEEYDLCTNGNFSEDCRELYKAHYTGMTNAIDKIGDWDMDVDNKHHIRLYTYSRDWDDMEEWE